MFLLKCYKKIMFWCNPFCLVNIFYACLSLRTILNQKLIHFEKVWICSLKINSHRQFSQEYMYTCVSYGFVAFVNFSTEWVKYLCSQTINSVGVFVLFLQIFITCWNQQETFLHWYSVIPVVTTRSSLALGFKVVQRNYVSTESVKMK